MPTNQSQNVQVTLDVSAELYAMMRRCVVLDRSPSVEKWIIGSVKSHIEFFANENLTDFDQEDIDRVYEQCKGCFPGMK